MEIAPVVLDGIRELITMGVGRAAGMLNPLTGAHITLSVPDVNILHNVMECHIHSVPEESASLVNLIFNGNLSGSTILIIPHISALNLVTILTGEEGTAAEMDALRVETLMEVGNIIISAIMSALCTLLETRLNYQIPVYRTGTAASLITHTLTSAEDTSIIAHIMLQTHKREIHGDIIISLSGSSFQSLKERILTVMGGDG
ncbi:MAG TPA: hypothetical protein VN372_14370 [Methanospirillum sp.]|nr:hypothetical protein [Methanospirillum sp.]